MIKKILKFFKFFVVGVVWTPAFLYLARWLMIWIWQFDIFYKKQWVVMAGFWNNNGVIIGFSDYMLFTALLVLILLWILGWRFFYKADYLKILMIPVNYIANYEIKKYEKEDKHVTFKNIAIAEKMTIEDVIQERIQKEKDKEHIKEADQLRKKISEKIIKRKEQ